MIATFGLQLSDKGQIHTDMLYQSSTPGLWVVGDILGVGGALSAAHQGGRAALAITRSWHFPYEV
jgi:pyruvate/2-oxoglutarate dehydrogenase complex dihydrolipoamide dehydrogenase (E3) component